jgi:hypothetical protein
MKLQDDGGNCVKRIFIICSLQQILLGRMRWARHVARMENIGN